MAGGAAIAQAIIEGVESAVNMGYGIYNNERNIKMQRENMEYLRDMQLKQWAREDTAVQRRKADLMAAGINPLLAAGQSASAGPIVSTSAPHSEAMNFDFGSEALKASRKAELEELQIEQVLQGIDESKARQGVSDARAAILRHDYEILEKAGILSTSNGATKAIADALYNLSKHRSSITTAGQQAEQKIKSTLDKAKNNLQQRLEKKAERNQDYGNKIHQGYEDLRRKPKNFWQWWKDNTSAVETY